MEINWDAVKQESDLYYNEVSAPDEFQKLIAAGFTKVIYNETGGIKRIIRLYDKLYDYFNSRYRPLYIAELKRFMIYKDNYAFIGGGLDDVGLLVVSVPLFSIPLIVIGNSSLSALYVATDSIFRSTTSEIDSLIFSFL